MKISKEMITAYANGTLPEKELPIVRKYFSEHPKELEEVLFLMNVSLHAPEISINSDISKVDDSAMYDAAFEQSITSSDIPITKENVCYRRKVDYLSNITKLLNEII